MPTRSAGRAPPDHRSGRGGGPVGARPASYVGLRGDGQYARRVLRAGGGGGRQSPTPPLARPLRPRTCPCCYYDAVGVGPETHGGGRSGGRHEADQRARRRDLRGRQGPGRGETRVAIRRPCTGGRARGQTGLEPRTGKARRRAGAGDGERESIAGPMTHENLQRGNDAGPTEGTRARTTGETNGGREAVRGNAAKAGRGRASLCGTQAGASATATTARGRRARHKHGHGAKRNTARARSKGTTKPDGGRA